jgi:hypothetical protein
MLDEKNAIYRVDTDPDYPLTGIFDGHEERAIFLFVRF